METTTITVNKDSEDEFVIKGYQKHTIRTAIYYLMGILSAGVVFLLGYWLPERRTKFTHVVCPLVRATTVIAIQGHKKAREAFICEIIEDNIIAPIDLCENDFVGFEKDIINNGKMRYFRHMFLRYYFTKEGEVQEISGLDGRLTKEQLDDMKDGMNAKSFNHKQFIHGKNIVDVPKKSFLLILIQFAADPLYIFQIISLIMWFVDDYIYYTTVIILMTVFSLLITTYETRKQMIKFQNMIGKPILVEVLQKDCKPIHKSSSELIPGDVFMIPQNGLELPCDSILIEGSCVVNESSLTGEGFPVSKTPISNLHIEDGIQTKTLCIDDIKHHSLFYGTDVLQVHRSTKGEYPTAMVLRTGFCTLKGRLIRSIIFPKPIYLKFFRDSMKFILFLACLGMIGIIYSMALFVYSGYDAFTVIKRGFDVITIIVPPVLPACMSVGLLFAVRRLRKKEIYCTDPQRVNLCGKLKLFVFDKTGTLTDDKLTVSGVIASKNSVLQEIDNDSTHLQNTTILKGMACCHSLALIDGTHTGYPLDCYMFEFTNWSLSKDLNCSYVEAPPDISGTQGSERIDILKEFPFASSLQRMSVIVKEKNDRCLTVYTKGSSEAVVALCKPDTRPTNLNEVMQHHTQRGHRVLAIASKQINVEADEENLPSRSNTETNLEFLGLIVFENKLKPSTKQTINLLQEGNIRTVMATGDNLYTAAYVARDVSIIKSNQKTVELSIKDNDVSGHILPSTLDEFDMSEKSITSEVSSTNSHNTLITLNGDNLFQNYFDLGYSCILTGKTYVEIKEKHPELLPKVLMSASVYARMLPSDKSLLIEDLKSLGYGVGMCGDGANDCGALKAAHAGIALSESEASVAAPFTSKILDISCVPSLICEGRAALVTSFSVFKYLASYSFIQFFGVLILYSLRSSYSDWQYTYADLVLCLFLALAMIQCGAVEKIAVRRPPGRLVHPLILLGFLVQVLLLLIFQIAAFFLPTAMKWYKPVTEFDNKGSKLNFTCYENYSVIITSFYQYIWLSVICSTGDQYRIPLYKNGWYILVFVTTTLLTTCINMIPSAFLRDMFQFPVIPSYVYSCTLIVLSLVHFYFAYVVDRYLLRLTCVSTLCNKLRGKVEPKNRYKHVYNNVSRDNTWPPAVILCKTMNKFNSTFNS